jgi:3-phenylpropionate/trans-cinnamate dioxygenase ferredoxin subunit
MHGSCFDLRTGEPTNLPATEPVSVYPVRVEGEDVYVDVDSSAADGTLPLAANS